MRNLLFAGCMLISVVARAETPVNIPFPGAGLFPQTVLGDDDALVRNLYEGRLFVPGPAYPVCQPDCSLTPKGEMHWQDVQGQNHFGLVVVAEPPEDVAAHADGALIGMVDLMQTPQGWRIVAGSPIVAETGSFGKAPPIRLVSAGIFGMAVIVMPGFTNQGETRQNWNLYIERSHVFTQVLSLSMTLDNSGKCDDMKCRKNDFTSVVTVGDDGASGLIVRMTKTTHDGHTSIIDYPIKP
jgi:hypothetical protein